MWGIWCGVVAATILATGSDKPNKFCLDFVFYKKIQKICINIYFEQVTKTNYEFDDKFKIYKLQILTPSLVAPVRQSRTEKQGHGWFIPVNKKSMMKSIQIICKSLGSLKYFVRSVSINKLNLCSLHVLFFLLSSLYGQFHIYFISFSVIPIGRFEV